MMTLIQAEPPRKPRPAPAERFPIRERNPSFRGATACGWRAAGLMITLISPLELAWSADSIRTPADARALGLDSLRLAVARDGGVPLPSNLSAYIKNRSAAIRLGKALFWDMQVGSDGVQSCASCHFHAGADDRAVNSLNPNQTSILANRNGGDALGYFQAGFGTDDQHPPAFEIKPVNTTLTRDDFPFVRHIQQLLIDADLFTKPAQGNSNDVVGSMGISFNQYDGINLGNATDFGTPLPDPLFSLTNGKNVRQVVGRNSPTTINAVFNFTNFWDGHANPHFNGLNAFGDQVPFGSLWDNLPGKGLVPTQVSIDNASLASQAMAPPLSQVEMAFGDGANFNARRFREIGQKLLRPGTANQRPLIPLGQQRVHPADSVLGRLSQWPRPGLAATYKAMIEDAFVDHWWNARDSIPLPSIPTDQEFTQMEANFSLFFGLAIALYESTLVADQTPFDLWMETGHRNRGFGRDELAGLNLFVNQGKCLSCHSGPELTSASVRAAEGGKHSIRAMRMAKGNALYDNGFYNTSVTPTVDDIGRGDRDAFLQPLAFSRQALWQRFSLGPDLEFPIFGNETIPALGEGSALAVCNDTNASGVCEPTEEILPDFQRVAVDGAFKTPGLRNAALTGPYFHNGGMATLRQVVQFYNRGGNFCSFNVDDFDTAIQPLGLTAREEEQLVAFLESLTDPRVRKQAAPFDHPELRIPEDGLDSVGRRVIKATGWYGDWRRLKPFLNLDPQDPIFTPAGVCQIDAST